ncbi:DivIVA domain-containing protein [Nonomuraea turcica]|uniref:DivIVA domain-containing protein n=1 Tax=Nonomuraea sp. G32 TaxID=3067274 RepID=UPI00273CD86E|nr:DivIVA domain-containing protein [Nonomuraea sp. G32]MDP4505396.1 DivIVA domain-containing protein [Nonomuraea sp. G32]
MHPDQDGHDHAPTEVLDERQVRTYLTSPAKVLDPTAVRNQVFTVVRLREGYDLTEVDAFLGHVEASLGVLLRENAELSARNTSDARSKADSARIIALAQETADRAVAAARQEADRITREARDRAEALVEESLDQAAAQQALERQVHSLSRSVTDYRDRLANTLQTQLSQIQHLLAELTEIGDSRPTSSSDADPITDRQPPE